MRDRRNIQTVANDNRPPNVTGDPAAGSYSVQEGLAYDALVNLTGLLARRGAELTTLPPRGLNRVTAAAYIGVSPSLFDQMVKDGRMPKPLRINTRVLWDRRLIDGAFDGLFEEDTPTPNPWDEK